MIAWDYKERVSLNGITGHRALQHLHLVELLIIAESSTTFDQVTAHAHAMGEAIIAHGQDMVDVSSVLGDRQAMLIRTTRRDFDAAVDALTPMLVELRAVKGVRVEMESKHRDELAERPITRHLV